MTAWNPTPDPETGRATLAEAVGQALGTASMCWENPAGAGVFDSTACGEVHDGLMAYLSDWADEHRRQANEATWAKSQAIVKEWSDIAYEMLAVLCNSAPGEHSKPDEWTAARDRLRDRFHAALDALPANAARLADEEPA